MRSVVSVVLFLTAAVVLIPLAAEGASQDPCLKCHEEKTPGIVNYWRGSVHPKEGVGCATCHGTDVEANHERTVKVTAEACAECHKKAYTEHRLSKHSISLRAGRGCTRNMPQSTERDTSCNFCHEPGSTKPIIESECAMFLAQSPQMQRQGCDTCHRVETDCHACHTRHGTDIALARPAEACATCHMGPDHAQYEMWKTSPHGVLFKIKGEEAAPTCVTCHMDGGTHNVSRGIATGRPADVGKKERAFMVGICARCHTPALAGRNLADADAIEAQSREMLGEAKAVIEGLQSKGLVRPAPSERPSHPLFGHQLVVGPHMLYENLSGVEAKFFRMMMFYYMSSFKGAFHQNPDYAHWYGNAPLKLALSELKSEAELLKEIEVLRERLENLTAGGGVSRGGGKGAIDARLRELKERWLKGELTDEEYSKQKAMALDASGL